MGAPRKAERERLAKRGKAETKAERGAPRGSYPTDSKKRARAAKSYASAAVNAGRMSPGTERGIDARADRELGKTKAKTKRFPQFTYVAFHQPAPFKESTQTKTFKGIGALTKARQYANAQREKRPASRTTIIERSPSGHTRAVYEA